MSETNRDPDLSQDFYEALQISPNAEPETIHRVYRLLAQRYHPDNRLTGDNTRFQVVHDAYLTLSDPERRARYDARYQETRRNRWRAIAAEARTENELELEEVTRLTVLELLYAQRRADLNAPGIFILDFEDLLGRPREHLEFTLWYLVQKRYIQRGDNSRFDITVEGVDYFEQNQRDGLLQRRLKPGEDESEAPERTT
jgi:curved DNA-binding protein CbpA